MLRMNELWRLGVSGKQGEEMKCTGNGALVREGNRGKGMEGRTETRGQGDKESRHAKMRSFDRKNLSEEGRGKGIFLPSNYVVSH